MRPPVALVRRHRGKREEEQAAVHKQAERIIGARQRAGREQQRDERDAAVPVQLEQPVAGDIVQYAK